MKTIEKIEIGDIVIKTFFNGVWIFWTNINMSPIIEQVDDGLQECARTKIDLEDGRDWQYKYWANVKTMRLLQQRYSISWANPDNLQHCSQVKKSFAA